MTPQSVGKERNTPLNHTERIARRSSEEINQEDRNVRPLLRKTGAFSRGRQHRGDKTDGSVSSYRQGNCIVSILPRLNMQLPWVAGGAVTVGSFAGTQGKVAGRALGFIIGAFAANGIMDNATAKNESHALCD